VRLYDDKICISGAQGADVTGLGAQEFRCRGFALPKSVESDNLSLNKVGIRWMSAQNIAISYNAVLPLRSGGCKFE
jgi:hypothetical protein